MKTRTSRESLPASKDSGAVSVSASSPRPASSPRGRNYGRWRHVMEQTLEAVYRGNWPARLWGKVPGSCVVTPVFATLPCLAPSAALGSDKEVRVAFVSDIHVGPTTPFALIEAAAAAVNAFAPHIVLFGGDFVFLRATPARLTELAAAIALFSKPGSVRRPSCAAVFGNHDLWTDSEAIGAVLEAAGVRVLVNEACVMHGITVVGVDEPWTGNPDLDAAFASARALTPEGVRRPTILLGHAPEIITLPTFSAYAGSIDLAVAGHTHGGHIAPFGRPIVVPGPTGRRHPAGFYPLPGDPRTVKGQLFVSRGVGATESALRLSAPPDVGLFTFVAAPETQP